MATPRRQPYYERSALHQVTGIVSHAGTREQARDYALAFADAMVERDAFDYRKGTRKPLLSSGG